MASPQAASSAASPTPSPSAKGSTASPTVSLGRPMTWAERLGGKASSSSSSSVSNSAQIAPSRTAASRSLSAGSSTQATQSIETSGPPASSSPKPSSSKVMTTNKQSPTMSNGSTATAPPSTSSPSLAAIGKAAVPTSADSGSSQVYASMEHKPTESRRNRTQTSSSSNTRSPPDPLETVTREPLVVGDDSQEENTSSTIALGTTTASDTAMPKPPGPPKVNIWQVRREEANRKAAEQAILKKEQQDEAKALQPQQEQQEQQEHSGQSQQSSAKTSTSKEKQNQSTDPTTSKGPKKKRDGVNQTSTPSSNTSPTTGSSTAANKTKGSEKKTTKQTSQSSSATSGKQSDTSASATKLETQVPDLSHHLNSGATAAGSQKQKAASQAETMKKAPLPKQEKHTTAPANTSDAIPSKNRKQASQKSQIEESRNNVGSEAAKMQDTSTTARSNDEKTPAAVAPTAGLSNGKDMSRSTSKQSGKNDSVTNSSVLSSQPIGDNNMSSSGTLASVANGIAEQAADKAASGTSAVLQERPSSDVKQTTSRSGSPAVHAQPEPVRQGVPLPSSLPAKPIGAPTSPPLPLAPNGSSHIPRLSPSLRNQPPPPSSTTNSVPPRRSPAAGSQYGQTPTPPTHHARSPMSYPADLYDASRSPSGGQHLRLPPYAMSPPVAGQTMYSSTLLPVQGYQGPSNGAMRGRRGGMASTGGLGRGGRGGSHTNRFASHGSAQGPRNQSPGSHGYNNNAASHIMGNQQIYPNGGGINNHLGHIPPQFYYDPNQSQPPFAQQQQQFDGSAYGVNMPTAFYPPLMYQAPPGYAPDVAYNNYGRSPAHQPARLPHLNNNNRRQSASHMAPPSETSQRSPPTSPIPQPFAMPPFQPMMGYPTLPGVLSNNGASVASPSLFMPPPSLTADRLPPSAPVEQAPGIPPASQQAHAAPSAPQQGTPPAYAKPSPLCDYSHIMFPPDGVAFWVLGQIEFYFSADNLVRDTFLRQSMDEEGWVDIQLIASFRRLSSLTQDIYLIRSMMELSFMCEVREMKVRTRDWRQWVIPGAKKVNWQFPDPAIQQQQQQPVIGQGQQYGHHQQFDNQAYGSNQQQYGGGLQSNSQVAQQPFSTQAVPPPPQLQIQPDTSVQ